MQSPPRGDGDLPPLVHQWARVAPFLYTAAYSAQAHTQRGGWSVRVLRARRSAASARVQAFWGAMAQAATSTGRLKPEGREMGHSLVLIPPPPELSLLNRSTCVASVDVASVVRSRDAPHLGGWATPSAELPAEAGTHRLQTGTRPSAALMWGSFPTAPPPSPPTLKVEERPIRSTGTYPTRPAFPHCCTLAAKAAQLQRGHPKPEQRLPVRCTVVGGVHSTRNSPNSPRPHAC